MEEIDLNKSLSVAMKYNSALEELNKEISKQQETRNLTITYTNKYKDTLTKEIELQKEKLLILQSFEEELERLLKL